MAEKPRLYKNPQLTNFVLQFARDEMQQIHRYFGYGARQAALALLLSFGFKPGNDEEVVRALKEAVSDKVLKLLWAPDYVTFAYPIVSALGKEAWIPLFRPVEKLEYETIWGRPRYVGGIFWDRGEFYRSVTLKQDLLIPPLLEATSKVHMAHKHAIQGGAPTFNPLRERGYVINSAENMMYHLVLLASLTDKATDHSPLTSFRRLKQSLSGDIQAR
jgi:hypothetical protein